jgi:hypothetical protein
VPKDDYMADTEARSRPGAEPDLAKPPADSGERLSERSSSRSEDGTPPADATHLAPDDQPTPIPRGFRAVLSVVGAVAAPSALVTGLIYYFAVKWQETLALYFGIDTSVLGFSTKTICCEAAMPCFWSSSSSRLRDSGLRGPTSSSCSDWTIHTLGSHSDGW